MSDLVSIVEGEGGEMAHISLRLVNYGHAMKLIFIRGLERKVAKWNNNEEKQRNATEGRSMRR